MCRRATAWVLKSQPPQKQAENGDRIPLLTRCTHRAKQYQGGLSEAQNGYGLGMIPGHGPRDAQFSSLVLDGSLGCKLSTAPELDRAQVSARHGARAQWAAA